MTGMLSLVKKHNRSTRVKLAGSFLLSSVLMIVLITAALTYLFHREIQDDVEAISMMSLSSANDSLSDLLDTSKFTAYEIFNNEQVKKLLYFEDLSIQSKINATRYLNNVLTAKSHLYSIYIMVNKKIVLSAGGSTIYEESDEAILPFLSNRYPMLYPFPRQVGGKTNAKQLLTTIYTTNNKKDASAPYVIVNFKTDALVRHADLLLQHPEQNVIVTDIAGTVLMHKDPEMFAKSVAEEPFFKNAKEQRAPRGMLEMSIEGKPSIVNYIKIENGSYTLFFTSPKHIFYQKTTELKQKILLSCLAAIVVILLLTVYLSYKIYNPISFLFRNIRNLIGNEAADQLYPNEIKFVQDSFTHLIDKVASLENYRNRNHLDLKNAFLNKLLTSSYSMTQQEFEQAALPYFPIAGRDATYRIIAIRIDHYMSFLEENSGTAIFDRLEAIESIVGESIEGHMDCATFTVDSEHVIALLGDKSGNALLDGEAVRERLAAMKESIQQRTLLQATIGIGMPFRELSPVELRKHYRQAFQLTNYRLVLGQGLVIDQGSVTRDADRNSVALLVNEVVGSVKTGTLEDFKSRLSSLFAAVRHSDYEYIMDILTRTAVQIANIPQNLQLQDTPTQSLNIDNAHRMLKRMEDYAEVEAWFTLLFLEVEKFIAGLKKGDATGFYQEMIAYIGENYSDADISAAMVAEKLGITPQYFSKLFNQYAGIKFPEYINALRLEKAREKLASDDAPNIKTVSQEVGFLNTSYFAASFKKKYGVSPSEYYSSTKQERKI